MIASLRNVSNKDKDDVSKHYISDSRAGKYEMSADFRSDYRRLERAIKKLIIRKRWDRRPVVICKSRAFDTCG